MRRCSCWVRSHVHNHIFPLSQSIYENLDAETSRTSWHWSIVVQMRKKRAHVTSLWADIWSDTLINICHPSSLLWGSRWRGCLLWVNGDWIDTAKWSVLAGGWFHLPGSFIFFFLPPKPSWLITQNQPALFVFLFHPSLDVSLHITTAN